MSKLENLRTNDWIVLTEVIPVYFPSPIPGVDSQATIPYCCNGIPLKVVAINAPWIVVNDGRFKGTIDSRFVSWTIASKQYRKALSDLKFRNEAENFKNLWYSFEELNKSNATEDSKDKLCPNCGFTLVTKRNAKGKWVLCCNDCKFIGEIQDD